MNYFTQEARSLASPSRIKYFDLVIATGNGALLTDADGKEYIDLFSLCLIDQYWALSSDRGPSDHPTGPKVDPIHTSLFC